MKKGNILLSLLALVAVTSANFGAGITCLGFFHQPECPEKLKKN